MEKAKNKKVRIIVWIVVALVLIYVIALLTGNTKPADEGNNETSAPSTQTIASDPSDDVYSTVDQEATSMAEPEPEPAPAKTPYKAELSSGNYTSGIDFPEGTYTITAISGSGNVSSDNMYSGGLNEIMSPDEDDTYIKEYKNAKLPKGTVLRISGVTVEISSDAADESTMEKRENPLTEEVTLSSGNFVAGTDFEAGTYDVVAISGSGNVSSDNMFSGGLNAIMSPEADDMYESEYKNIELPEGTTLTISGVEIKLVPSK